ncbi:hypothetical protein ANO11243_088170 [Dothideomycetidae sp. 11243]|nr:hypothetical protein ANO11243_088170 [fungal sp. No.11243]
MIRSTSLWTLLWCVLWVVQSHAALPRKVVCSSKDVSIVQFQKDVDRPAAFCTYWLAVSVLKTDNPLGNLNAADITAVCQCISGNPALITKKVTSTTSAVATVATRPCSPQDQNVLAVEHAFLHPILFCNYYIGGKTSASASSTHAVATIKASPTTTPIAKAGTSKATFTSKASVSAAPPVPKPASTTHFVSSHTPTSSKRSTSKGSLITGSLPAKATSKTASAARVPASTNVAGKPAVPSTVNKSSTSNFSPSKNNTLAFLDASSSSFSATSDATFKYPAVILDYSSLIASVVCSAKNTTLTVKFTNQAAETQAFKYWKSQPSLLLVTSVASCSSSGADYYFLATSLSQSSTTITIKGSSKAFADVVSSYGVKFSAGSSGSASNAVKGKGKSTAGAIAQIQHSINSLGTSNIVSSPWGQQSQLFNYVPSADSIFQNLDFYESLTLYAVSEALLDNTIVTPEVTMYCIDCSIGGSLSYSGSYTSSSSSASLLMSLTGSLDLDFKVGINAFAPLTTTVNIPVGQFVLPSVQMGNLLNVQPIIQISLVGALTINGPGQIILGSQTSWSNVDITLDTNTLQASISGGSPVANYPFSVDGPADGAFSMTAQASVVLQYTGSGGALSQISFQDTRTISAQSSSDPQDCYGILWSSYYTATDIALSGLSSTGLLSSNGNVNQICVDDLFGNPTTITTDMTATETDWPDWETATGTATDATATDFTTGTYTADDDFTFTGDMGFTTNFPPSASPQPPPRVTSPAAPPVMTSTTSPAAFIRSTSTVASPTTSSQAASSRSPPPAGCVPNLYTFVTSDNQLWQLNSTLGWSGSLPTVEGGSIDDCITQCDTYGSTCAGLTWIEYGMQEQYCFLATQSDLSNPLLLSGYVGVSASRLSGTSCMSTQAPLCPGDDGGYYRSSNGYPYGVDCSFQYTGTVLAYVDGVTSLQQCMEACDPVTDCTSVSFAYGGSLGSPTCTIFNSTSGAVASAQLGYSVDSGYAIKA